MFERIVLLFTLSNRLRCLCFVSITEGAVLIFKSVSLIGARVVSVLRMEMKCVLA